MTLQSLITKRLASLISIFGLMALAACEQQAASTSTGTSTSESTAVSQPSSRSADLVGPATRVRDGDTIEVSGVPIRFNGVTCDERGSALGNQATARMREIVAGQTLSCDLNGDKSYDRLIGSCSLPNGADLGAVMISEGLCGRCARYDKGGRYTAVQARAGAFAGSMPGYCRT